MYALSALLNLVTRLAACRRALPMQELLGMDPATQEPLLVIRCDVERDPAHALAFAQACAERGARISLYFHTRRDSFDDTVLKALHEKGHEASYHHECLDRTRGDFAAARELFLREVALFRKRGLPLNTVCAHGESGLKKVGYRATYELFDRYPNLLAETGIGAEVYRQINPVWQPAYPSDVFSSYRHFFVLAEAELMRPGLMQLLIHPHRWRRHTAHSIVEVGADLAQAGRNKLLGSRSYQTITT